MSGLSSRLFSDQWAVIATIDPDNYSSGTQSSDWADMSNYEQFCAILLGGQLDSASKTISVSLQQGTNSTGGSAKAIASAASTTYGSTSYDDSQVIVQGRTDVMDIASSFDYIRAQVTCTSTAADYGLVLLGGNPSHAPASDNDLGSVAGIVTATS